MAKAFTSDKLITSVKRRAMIPSSQSTFTTDDFLDFANEEIDNELIPEILRLHEDYLLTREDVTLVANQSRYVIPSGAIGNKVRDVAFLDTNGNIYEMTRIHAGDLSHYASTSGHDKLYSFMVEGSDIVLVPEIDGTISGSLRFFYYKKPNEIVATSRTATITAINSTTEVVVDAIPTENSLSIFSLTDDYDIVNHKEAFNSIESGISVTSIAGTTITFSSEISSAVKIGDYVNLEGESSVIQLPSEVHSMLAHKVAMRCIEAMGDAQGLQIAEAKNKRMMDRMTNLLDNRVEDSPKKIVNRTSSLRQGLNRRRYHRRG